LNGQSQITPTNLKLDEIDEILKRLLNAIDTLGNFSVTLS